MPQPLAYDAYYERLFTGFGGVQLRSMLTRSLGAAVGLGAEADITRDANNFVAQSLIPGLPFLNLDHGASWNAPRPSATASAFYAFSPTQRLFLNSAVG